MGGRAAAESRAITIKGSDTMVILAQRWIESYRDGHPDARIQLTGGGSLTGIAALQNRTTDIATSSRSLHEEEITRLEAKSGRKLRQIPVALDVLSIYVHPSNPVESLSLHQLHDIFTGKTRSWKEVGGRDAPIAVYGRDNNSGSHRILQEMVLGDEDFFEGIESLPGTGAVVDSVANDENGLGYGGIAYARGVKHLAVRRADDSPPVPGTAETARSGDYRLARTLYLDVFEPLDPDVQTFVAWVLGPDGQAVVEQVGYYPLKP